MEHRYSALKEVVEYNRNFQKKHLSVVLSKDNYALFEGMYQQTGFTFQGHLKELHSVYLEVQKTNPKEAQFVLQALIFFSVKTLRGWFDLQEKRILPFSARLKMKGWLEQHIRDTFQFLLDKMIEWRKYTLNICLNHTFLQEEVFPYLSSYVERFYEKLSLYDKKEQILREKMRGVFDTILRNISSENEIKVGTIVFDELEQDKEISNLWRSVWRELLCQKFSQLSKEFFMYEDTLILLSKLKPELKLLEIIESNKINITFPSLGSFEGDWVREKKVNSFCDEMYSQIDSAQLLAEIKKVNFDFYLPKSNRQRHTYILGKSGSGKTELLKVLLHKDIQEGHGIFLLDPHGDLAEECFRFRLFEQKGFRNRLVYLSPEFANQGVMPKYNPLEYNPKGNDVFEKRNDLSVRALELANGFQAVFKSEFSDNMRSLLINAFKLLLEAKNVHLGHLIELLIPEGNGIAPYHRIISHHWDAMLKNYFLDIFPAKRLNAAKLAIVTRFDVAFSNQALRSMFFTVKPSFNFGKLLDEGKIIIVNAKQGKLSSAGTNILGALMTSELTIMALQRANRPKSKRKPVYAYIDECQNFMNEKMDKLLAEARKYGVHLIMANQFLGQFEGMSRLKQSILANTAIKFCGSSSAQDQIVMGREMRFDFSQNIFLGKGRFVCGIDPYSGVLMQTSSDLIPPLDGNANYVNKKTALTWREEQIELYYRPFQEKEEEENLSEKNEELLPTKKKQFRIDEL